VAGEITHKLAKIHAAFNFIFSSAPQEPRRPTMQNLNLMFA
jgi:hypothetical protein